MAFMFRLPVLVLLLLTAFHRTVQATAPLQAPIRQDPIAVVDAIERFIQEQAGVASDKLDISVQPPRVAHLPACRQIQPYFPQRQGLRARLIIGVHCTAPHTWTAFVPAVIALQGCYYAASRTIQAGETIKREDLVLRKGDLLSLPEETLLNMPQALGMVATRRIAAGTPLSMRSLRDPIYIQRGQKVRTRIHGQGFVATGEGRALENGGAGSHIRIRTGAGKIISGVVVDTRTVQVHM